MASSWFNESYYLSSKLAQLQSQGINSFDVNSLTDAIHNAGMSVYDHFMQFSLSEGTSPNPFFDSAYYLQQKASHDGVSQGSIVNALSNAGLNLWQHFSLYGWSEGLNPFSGFDVSNYLSMKANSSAISTSELSSALQNLGMDPLSHFLSYGHSEGISIPGLEWYFSDSQGSGSGDSGNGGNNSGSDEFDFNDLDVGEVQDFLNSWINSPEMLAFFGYSEGVLSCMMELVASILQHDWQDFANGLVGTGLVDMYNPQNTFNDMNSLIAISDWIGDYFESADLSFIDGYIPCLNSILDADYSNMYGSDLYGWGAGSLIPDYFA